MLRDYVRVSVEHPNPTLYFMDIRIYAGANLRSKLSCINLLKPHLDTRTLTITGIITQSLSKCSNTTQKSVLILYLDIRTKSPSEHQCSKPTQIPELELQLNTNVLTLYNYTSEPKKNLKSKYQSSYPTGYQTSTLPG